MRSTPVHIKDKNELKFIVPFVFHFLKKKSQENQTFFLKGQTNKLTEAMKCLEQTLSILQMGDVLSCGHSVTGAEAT